MQLFSRFTAAKNRASAMFLALCLSVVSLPAFAQTAIGFDSAGVLGIVDEATAFVIAVGLAVLGLIMVAKGVKWARKAG